jgi:hypothetical protein
VSQHKSLGFTRSVFRELISFNQNAIYSSFVGQVNDTGSGPTLPSASRDHRTLPPLGPIATPRPSAPPSPLAWAYCRTRSWSHRRPSARVGRPRTGEGRTFPTAPLTHRRYPGGWPDAGVPGVGVIAAEGSECHAGRLQPERRLWGGAVGESAFEHATKTLGFRLALKVA